MSKEIASEIAPPPDERAKLEIEKLRAELAELKRPIWKQPAYLAVFLPVGLAAITLIGAVVTGYFDAERKRLEAERAQLQSELNALKSTRDTLQVQTVQLRKDGQAIVTQLHTSLAAMKNAADDKEGQLADLIKKLDKGKVDPIEVRNEAQSIRSKLNGIQANITASELKLKEHSAFDGPP